jgi:hypothetical protein
MGDTKNGILKSTKLLLGTQNDDEDELLLLLIDDTINAVLSYCRLEVLPRQLESFIPQLTASRRRAEKTDGVKSVTEGERRVEYADITADFLSEYKSRLSPFINRSVKLPSELGEEEDCDDKSV